jgi:enolase
MTDKRSARIKLVHARQVLDSRGRPTVEADITLEDGSQGRACAPSGASTGRWEAVELRDGDDNSFEGRGVLRAAANVCGRIASRIIGFDSLDQGGIDQALVTLDGISSAERLGSNAMVATSLAVSRAAAAHRRIPLYRYIAELANSGTASLPMPMVNILSGGAHAARGMDFQDFLAVPVGATRYCEALEMVSRVRNCASTLMKARGLSVLLADEGGLSPGFPNAETALELMVQSIEHARLRPGIDVAIALDVAASEFHRNGAYVLEGEKKSLSGAQMADYLIDLSRRFPIISIEDALDQDDWDHWRTLTRALPEMQIVGDDLFATNSKRIAQGIEQQAANAALIKVNQNGTLSGTIAAMASAQRGDYATIVSARSGETEDSFVADFAVGTGAGQIKIGSVRSSERLAKYNQLLRLEEESGLEFAGTSGISGSRYRPVMASLDS